MLKLTFLRVRPDKVSKLREWMDELNRRRPEVLETLCQERTRHEIVALLEAPEPLLVYAMEAEDLDHAARQFAASQLPIDVQHRAIMRECIEGEWPHELLLQVATPAESSKG